MKSDDIATAIHLISRLGLTVDDLDITGPQTTTIPTFTEYIAKLRRALPPTTVTNYDTYWRVTENAWGAKKLDEPTPTEIEQLVNDHRARAVVRINSRDGRGAAIKLIAALRCLYHHAEQDDLIHPAKNPAAKVKSPPQLPGRRHSLSLTQVTEMADVASSTGNDPELDALIIRLHLETACRRGGTLRLEITDLNASDCLIRLREKGGTVRWQPISPSLTHHLLEHIRTRGGLQATPRLLRYRNGRPIGRRRFDYISERLRKHLHWAAVLQVSVHWVRHTTLTWVEREYSYAVAHAYAGHANAPTRAVGATLTYVQAGLPEVAHALSVLTGEPHPLAATDRHPLSAQPTALPRPATGKI